MQENVIHGLEQGRAETAYDRVKAIVDDFDPEAEGLDEQEVSRRKKVQKAYKTNAKKLPVLIITNGLGQALAYTKTRNATLYQDLTDWLYSRGLIQTDDDLVSEVIRMDSNEYRRLTTETLAFLNWVRRFVDGLMPQVDEDEDDSVDYTEADTE